MNFKKLKLNLKKLTAFTMAEAILVMTILGVIAAITMSTLKKGNYKERALIIHGKKLLDEIDYATKQIIVNNSADEDFNILRDSSGTSFNSMGTTTEMNKLADLYKSYLGPSRKKCNNTNCPCYENTSIKAKFYLKDGSCIKISKRSGTGQKNSMLPGETASKRTTSNYQIFFDVNGEKEPNYEGIDRFYITYNESGLIY